MRNPVNETFGDICPKGHYCEEASQAATPCPEGTFSDEYANENLTSCLPCTAGQYCSGTGRDLPNGDCDVGWYCLSGSTQPQPVNSECLAGHACPVGSPNETPCTSGNYQSITGQGSCSVCPAGKYCDQLEAISEEQSGVGETSHGVVTPKNCPAGFYCPEGTQTSGENPCPIGTYSNTTALENSTQCTQCDPGYYCETASILKPTGQCFVGFYCSLAATSPNSSECEQGTYCEIGSSQPTDCPKGMYGSDSQLTALSDCTICPPGSYCGSPRLSAPSGDCSAGFFCSNASEEASPVGSLYGDECPVGHYCPQASGQPIACAAGTYQPNTRRTNETACLDCDPGSYCSGTGLFAVTGYCSEGMYNLDGMRYFRYAWPV